MADRWRGRQDFLAPQALGAGPLVALLAGAAVGAALGPGRLVAVQLQTAPLVRSLQFSARVAAWRAWTLAATITARVAQVRWTKARKCALVRHWCSLSRRSWPLAQAQALARRAPGRRGTFAGRANWLAQTG